MTNEIKIEEIATSVLHGTGYSTWLDFGTNLVRVSTEDNQYVYNPPGNGKIQDIRLPFGRKILDILMKEELTLLLGKLGYANFFEFEKSLRRANPIVETFDPVEIFVKINKSSIILRRYVFTEDSIAYLRDLSSKQLKYRIIEEGEIK
jgi:hypothetical protein